MQQKRHIENLLHHCSGEQFGQDAIEHAILTGSLELTYDLPTDIHQIYDPHSACCDAPPLGELSPVSEAVGLPGGLCRQFRNHATFSTRYDEFCEAWRAHRNELNHQSMDALHPLFEEVLRPYSLAERIPEKSAT